MVPVVVVVVAGWLRRWTTDDGFINYRIVDLLVHGHGPVFNIGQRVEAYTSPLWLASLAVGDVLLPWRLEYVGVALGIGFAALGVGLLGVGARLLLGDDGRRVWVPAGAALLVALPAVWDWTTSGLEFGLTMAWLGGLSLVLARWANDDRPLSAWEAVLVGLGPLVRPDTTIFTVVALAVVVLGRWREESWGTRVRVVGAALAVPVAYELFRMAYFASLLPNTALAKESSHSAWEEGWAYLWNLIGPYALWFPLACLLVIGVVVGARQLGHRRLAILALPIAGLLNALYIVRVGGDYQHARLLLPALVGLVAPVAVVPLRRTLVVPLLGVWVWALIAAVALRAGTTTITNFTGVSDERAGNIRAFGFKNPVTLEQQAPRGIVKAALANYATARGVWINGHRLPVTPRPGTGDLVVIQFGVGAYSYGLGAHVDVVDRLGLADPLVSRFELRKRGFIGHEKPVPTPWLAALVTTDHTKPNFFPGDEFGVIRSLYESPLRRYDADVQAARATMKCEPLRTIADATTGPLGPGKLVANLFRAPRLTTLRIPPDPQEARRRLCPD